MWAEKKKKSLHLDLMQEQTEFLEAEVVQRGCAFSIPGCFQSVMQ